MFSESAELYDLIYARFKDYPAEARQVADLLGTVHARCRTILDVACGTGEHASLLAAHHGFEVYEIAEPEGTRRASEVHELGLFTTDEMLRSFDAAGLVAEYDARGLCSRGLYVAEAAR